MTNRFFIGVVHQAHVLMARAMGIVAFSHGKEAPVRTLAPGDAVLFYAPKTDFDGDPVQAFVGHAHITGATHYQRDFAPGLTAWVRDAAFDDVTDLPVRPLLHHLSFVKNPQHWGMAFRQGKFAIPEPDYRLISQALLEPNT
jgi:hypothetical protein